MTAVSHSGPSAGATDAGRGARERPGDDGSSSAQGLGLCGAALAALCGLTWVFCAWSATSAGAFPRFVAVVCLVLYVPGRLALRAIGVIVHGIEEFALALLLGCGLASALYWVLAVLGARSLFPAWPVFTLLAAALMAWNQARHSPRGFRPSADRWAFGLLGLVVAGWIVLAILPAYYRNLTRGSDGALRLHPLPDVVFHLSIAQELGHSVPPQAPFLPGHPLRYHYGMDLLVALLADVSGLSVPDLTLRFVPSLLVALLAVAAFAFGRGWLGSSAAALLLTGLLLFGEDLSWIPGLATGAAGSWPVEFFGTPTVVSLYLLNPILPALAAFFGFLLAAHRFVAGQGRSYALLAAGLLALAGSYKVFLAVHAAAALLLAGGWLSARRRDSRLLALGTLAAAAVAVVAVPLAVEAQGGPMRMSWRMWPYVPGFLVRCGLFETALGRAVHAAWEGKGGPAAAAAFAGLALPLYLVGSLGPRVLALPLALRDVFAPAASAGLRLFLSMFVLLGVSLGLLTTLTPAGFPQQLQYNNSVWFLVQAEHAAGALVVGALVSSTTRAPRARLLGALLLLATGLPSTVQHLALSARESPRPVPGDALAIAERLAVAGRPGDVVLAPPAMAQLIVSTAPLRAPLIEAVPPSFVVERLSPDELVELHRELGVFWAGLQRGNLRAETLQRLQVSFVVAPRALAGPLAAKLAPVAQNDSFTLFATRRSGR